MLDKYFLYTSSEAVVIVVVVVVIVVVVVVVVVVVLEKEEEEKVKFEKAKPIGPIVEWSIKTEGNVDLKKISSF